jgi:hypothetical protein
VQYERNIRDDSVFVEVDFFTVITIDFRILHLVMLGTWKETARKKPNQ